MSTVVIRLQLDYN